MAWAGRPGGRKRAARPVVTREDGPDEVEEDIYRGPAGMKKGTGAVEGDETRPVTRGGEGRGGRRRDGTGRREVGSGVLRVLRCPGAVERQPVSPGDKEDGRPDRGRGAGVRPVAREDLVKEYAGGGGWFYRGRMVGATASLGGGETSC